MMRSSGLPTAACTARGPRGGDLADDAEGRVADQAHLGGVGAATTTWPTRPASSMTGMSGRTSLAGATLMLMGARPRWGTTRSPGGDGPVLVQPGRGVEVELLAQPQVSLRGQLDRTRPACAACCAPCAGPRPRPWRRSCRRPTRPCRGRASEHGWRRPGWEDDRNTRAAPSGARHRRTHRNYAVEQDQGAGDQQRGLSPAARRSFCRTWRTAPKRRWGCVALIPSSGGCDGSGFACATGGSLRIPRASGRIRPPRTSGAIRPGARASASLRAGARPGPSAASHRPPA